jgi:hypothetical protein
MNVALRTAMTLKQFLARAERQELRCELDWFHAAVQVQQRRNYRNPAA